MIINQTLTHGSRKENTQHVQKYIRKPKSYAGDDLVYVMLVSP